MTILPNDPINPIITEEITDRYQNTPASMLNVVQESGMNLLTYLSAQAMTGLLASGSTIMIGKRSVRYAQELIKALNDEEL